MMHLPPLLIPSSLLYREGITSRAEVLLRECLLIDSRTRWREVRGLAQEAAELQAQGDQIGYAVLSLYLGDRCLEMGRLGPARRHYEQAKWLFCRHEFKPEQCHNKAVAAYALGLIDQFLGDEKEALSQYEDAIVLFARAQNHWQRVGNEELEQRCEEASELIEKLIDYIMQVLSTGGTAALSYLLSQRRARTGDGFDESPEAGEEFGTFVRDAAGKFWRIPLVRIIPDDD